MSGSAQRDELRQSLEFIHCVNRAMMPLVERMTPQRRQALIENRDFLAKLLEDCFFPDAKTADGLKRFDPASFIGKGWRRGEQDSRVSGIGIPDTAKLTLVTHLKKGEERTTGEERRARIRNAKQVSLGPDQFLYFWENRDQIPEAWKEKTGGNTTYIFFDGEELVNPVGNRYTLYLYWYDGRWIWNYFWLDNVRNANYPSVVLASELGA